MSSAFLIIECWKCESLQQINWPFHNILKLYSNSCKDCSDEYSLRTKINKNEYLAKEVICEEFDIPKQLSCQEKRVYYFSYRYVGDWSFAWFHLKANELKFPVLLLDYEMNHRHQTSTLSTGILPFEELEYFLKEVEFTID